MQTYSQTFAADQTWELNVAGKYFTTLQCNQAVNVRFFKGGKKLDLGDITSLLAGLEVTLGNIDDLEPAFDRVQIDVKAGDTVQVGIGNGQARYNRANASVNVLTNKQPQSGVFANTQKTVTNSSTQLVAANTSRQYLLIQNKDTTASVWVNFGASAATVANGVLIGPKGTYEMNTTQSTQAIQAIGDVASNANVVVLEG
jgi:hypothetical protein